MEKLTATISCSSSSNYWGTDSSNTYFGLSATEAMDYPHSIMGSSTNSFVNDVDLSVSATHIISLVNYDMYKSNNE